jgi:hypothetical protein
MAAPEVPPPADEPRTPKKTFALRLAGRVEELAVEFIGTFVAIAGIGIADLLVKWFVGEGKKFFGLLPVQWVFDAAHVCVIGRLIWRIFSPPKDE